MNISVAFAYFQSSDGAGGVFDSLESMISTLQSRWNSVADIDFVQRSDRRAAELWLREKMENKNNTVTSIERDQTKKRRTGKRTTIGNEVNGNRIGNETPTSMSVSCKRPCLPIQSDQQGSELSCAIGSKIQKEFTDDHNGKNSTSCNPYPSESDVLVVYTDGACINNGKGHQARGGYGVWFGENDKRNTCGPLPRGSPHTNQRAELYAIQRALEITCNDPRHLVLKSDSKYAMQCVTDWLPNWEKNGFITANKTPVKNRDLIQPIDSLIKERGEGRIEFQHVKGHGGDIGNEAADRLANMGALQT